jgi:uncharacterized repeat protein (TIGR01451 family)
MRKHSGWQRSSDLEGILRGALLGFLLLAPAGAAAQTTTSGLSLKKTCPSNAVAGDTVTCTIAVENQDPANAVTSLVVTNQVPFPGGPILPVAGCSSMLGPSDGTPDSGPDFTSCEASEVLDQECTGITIGVIDQAVAEGQNTRTGQVRNTTTNAVIVFCGGEVIPPEPVPAASTAGLVLLTFGLAAFGAARMRRGG